MKSFANLPPLMNLLLGYFGMPSMAGMVNDELIASMESFCKAARTIREHADKAGVFIQEMSILGFPLGCGAITLALFDLVGDTMRGLRGILLDMFRQPDELLAAIDKVPPLMIDGAIAQCEMTGNPGVFIPLHKRSDGFMSLEQFETFYWPSLKKLILTLIDHGLTPCPFFEGDHSDRLEYYAKLPNGGCIMGPKTAMDEADPNLVKVWFDFIKEYEAYA